MRKSNLDRHQEALSKNAAPTLVNGYDGFVQHLLGGAYNPTQKDFLYSKADDRVFMGAAGSGKTLTCVIAGLVRCLFTPGTHGIIARHDYNKLMGTTLETLQMVMNRLPPGTILAREKAPPQKWSIKPVVDGPASDIRFLSLKDNLGSYEAHWAFVDEADDCEEKKVLELKSRLRSADLGDGHALMLAFNPPDKTHWLYEACTGFDYKDRKVRDPIFKVYTPRYKENAHNLRSNYYEEMEMMFPEDMRQRLVMGEWGSVFPGQAVYKQFKPEIHVKELQYDPYVPLYRFWDFGYNVPTCIWAQIDGEGRLLILREEIGSQIEAAPFAQRCTLITNQNFHNAQEIRDYGDPAARQKKDTGSTLGILHREGITLRYIVGVTVRAGIRSVRKRLETLISASPAIQFDRNCRVLIAGLRGGYRLEENNPETPYKDGYYEHVQDALRYGVVNLFGAIGDNMHFHQAGMVDNISYDPRFDPLAG